jgi:hypothetical protein
VERGEALVQVLVLCWWGHDPHTLSS